MIKIRKFSGQLFGLNMTFAGLFLRKEPRFCCPVCGGPVLPDRTQYNTRVQCAGCAAWLVVVPSHEWLYVFFCLCTGFTIAYLQGLQNPLFVMVSLAYSGAIVVIAAPILAPFIRPKLRVASDYIQKLEIPKR
jgi:hypothetical protein